MSDDSFDILDTWIISVLQLIESDDPRNNLKHFLLDFEQEVYNRALVDVLKNISNVDHSDIGPILGKVMALRLAKIPAVNAPPGLRDNVVSLFS